MSERNETGAAQIRRATGTADCQFQVAVLGTRRRSGKPARLRTFVRSQTDRSWSIDTAYLNRRLESGDPADVDKVISAQLSRQHARLGPNRNAWHLTRGVDVPIKLMSVILDAHHDANRSMVAIDDIKDVVSQLGSTIIQFTELPIDSQQHTRTALYNEILRRCASFE